MGLNVALMTLNILLIVFSVPVAAVTGASVFTVLIQVGPETLSRRDSEIFGIGGLLTAGMTAAADAAVAGGLIITFSCSSSNLVSGLVSSVTTANKYRSLKFK